MRCTGQATAPHRPQQISSKQKKIFSHSSSMALSQELCRTTQTWRTQECSFPASRRLSLMSNSDSISQAASQSQTLMCSPNAGSASWALKTPTLPNKPSTTSIGPISECPKLLWTLLVQYVHFPPLSFFSILFNIAQADQLRWFWN